MPDIRQTAGNAIGAGQSTTCQVAMNAPTLPGSLVVVIASSSHAAVGGSAPNPQMFGPSGFTRAMVRTEDELTLAVWYRAGCPSVSLLGVAIVGPRALQVQVLEYTAVAQSSALDRISFDGDNDEYGPGSRTARSGSTATTSQADEVVIGAIANRYPSTRQSGFTGGLVPLSDTVTPATWGNGRQDSDDERNRLTVHQTIATTTKQFSVGASLTGIRDWVAVVLTFRGGTTGPARMTSLTAPPVLVTGGGGDLTAFGPLRSLTAAPVLITGGSGRIGPFVGQFRLGGWTGLLIGDGTPFRVGRVEGLGGMEVRTSDGPYPRGDGEQRGIDLQAARQVIFGVNFDAAPAEMSALRAQLSTALVPQPDTDWDLMFRDAGMPLQIVRARPVQLSREQNQAQMFVESRTFALRCADPRIYSARERVVELPITPAGAVAVTATSALNEGNARAYPVIQLENRDSFPVTSIELVNATADVAFEVNAIIPPGGQLVGDMPAFVTAAPRSVVTVDGQSKYGSWQPPRSPFYLAPSPAALGGVNAVYLRTTPAGANVQAVIQYRDTWAT